LPLPTFPSSKSSLNVACLQGVYAGYLAFKVFPLEGQEYLVAPWVYEGVGGEPTKNDWKMLRTGQVGDGESVVRISRWLERAKGQGEDGEVEGGEGLDGAGNLNEPLHTVFCISHMPLHYVLPPLAPLEAEFQDGAKLLTRYLNNPNYVEGIINVEESIPPALKAPRGVYTQGFKRGVSAYAWRKYMGRSGLGLKGEDKVWVDVPGDWGEHEGRSWTLAVGEEGGRCEGGKVLVWIGGVGVDRILDGVRRWVEFLGDGGDLEKVIGRSRSG
jgi:hypothetical protein